MSLKKKKKELDGNDPEWEQWKNKYLASFEVLNGKNTEARELFGKYLKLYDVRGDIQKTK